MNPTGMNVYTPLMAAAEAEHLGMVTELLAAGSATKSWQD
jgi:hypothetical protein